MCDVIKNQESLSKNEMVIKRVFEMFSLYNILLRQFNIHLQNVTGFTELTDADTMCDNVIYFLLKKSTSIVGIFLNILFIFCKSLILCMQNYQTA